MARELEQQRTKHEAHDTAAGLVQYVALALESGTSPDEVNAYLRQVRDFIFRVRPNAPKRLEVVR